MKNKEIIGKQKNHSYLWTEIGAINKGDIFYTIEHHLFSLTR